MGKNNSTEEEISNLQHDPRKRLSIIRNGIHLNLARPTEEQKKDQNNRMPEYGISKRFEQAWLVNIGLILIFGMRCNLSVAIVKMMSVEDNVKTPSYLWTPETVSLVQSSVFWG